MHLFARRIRSLNRVMAAINGRRFHNEDKPPYPVVLDRSLTRIVYVPPSQL
jgi:hypothetical protein